MSRKKMRQIFYHELHELFHEQNKRIFLKITSCFIRAVIRVHSWQSLFYKIGRAIRGEKKAVFTEN